MQTPVDPVTLKIQALNDILRTKRVGGQIVFSSGLMAKANKYSALQTILRVVAQFSDFTKDNDPHGEHDCAFVNVPVVGRVMFKIDYYDRQTQYGSDDPTNPEVTNRVMTIMLPEDY